MSSLSEQDIIYEAGPVWIYRDKRQNCYTVFIAGITHSVSDSSYPRDPGGLSLAIARAKYLAKSRWPIRRSCV